MPRGRGGSTFEATSLEREGLGDTSIAPEELKCEMMRNVLASYNGSLGFPLSEAPPAIPPVSAGLSLSASNPIVKNCGIGQDSVKELHLFAGCGGGILGGHLLGHRVVGAVELSPKAREVLKKRQDEGILPEFPLFGDICSFDGREMRGSVDIVCGGFPCQDISAMGSGDGISGARSGLWKEMARVIEEVEPKFVFVENSPLLLQRGMEVVVGDLISCGYDIAWGILGAGDLGAPHKRNRCWILASKDGSGGVLRGGGDGLTNHEGGKEIWGVDRPKGVKEIHEKGGVKDTDRIKACGNGQVPIVAAAAWVVLSSLLGDRKGSIHAQTESFFKFVKGGGAWKTHNWLWEEDLSPDRINFPKFGVVRNGIVFDVVGLSNRTTNHVLSMPTPTASDHKRTPIKKEYANRVLTEAVPDDLAKWVVRQSELDYARLNPEFWEWAMGWPQNWTSLDKMDTGSFREWENKNKTAFGLPNADVLPSVLAGVNNCMKGGGFHAGKGVLSPEFHPPHEGHI